MRHSGLQPLWNGLQREWRQQQVVAAGLLTAGVGMLCISAINTNLWLGLFGSLSATISIIWLLKLSQRKPVSELYHLLKEEPATIRWVYTEITERQPFGFKFSSTGTIYFVLEDGEKLCVTIRKDKLKLVSKTLNRVLPNTAFGYTEERDAKFGPKL